jgi:hypothetical protein
VGVLISVKKWFGGSVTIPDTGCAVRSAFYYLRTICVTFFLFDRVDHIYLSISDFGGLGVCVLASGTQDRGFAPDRRIFRNGKILSTQYDRTRIDN